MYCKPYSLYTVNMTKYIAMLRGAGPGNPNMHQHKLIAAVEALGFSNVHAVISSGNVIFESDSTDSKTLESRLEKMWPVSLGFISTTIVRSQVQLQNLIAANPFKDIQDLPGSRLNVTFLKDQPANIVAFPHHGLRFYAVGEYDGAVCSVLDLSGGKTPGVFSWVDEQYGPENTSRTWKTVQRILKKME